MKCDCKDCAFRGMELCEQRKLMDENAKLREALKPIVACDVSFKNSPCGLCWGLNDNCMEARFCGRYSFFRAVRKAQEIMKGEKK